MSPPVAIAVAILLGPSPAAGAPAAVPPGRAFLETHCFDCHDSASEKAGLDLESLTLDPADPRNVARWTLVFDRITAGDMPPKKRPHPPRRDQTAFLRALSGDLTAADRARIATTGRARMRRMNRFEYENALREGLRAPWLRVADLLPEDGVVHLFNKSSEQLNVSHVQLTQYLKAAEQALRTAISAAAHRTATNRFHAREEPVMKGYLRYKPNIQVAATRATIPLLGLVPQPDVVRGTQPLTVGEADPVAREQEAMGFVSSAYAATTKYDFTRLQIPIDGRYRVRMKTYTFRAGPGGADGGDDHGLTGGQTAWWRPSRTQILPGNRTEPVTLYALTASQETRWLATFDALPEARVIEREVVLQRGDRIRPDAARLVRTRPGWAGNPNAAPDGVPGFAMNWLELEGPLHDSWPPPSYRAVFDDLSFEVASDGQVRALPADPEADARRLLTRFIAQMVRRPAAARPDAEAYVNVYRSARALGEDFTGAMLAAFSAVLCASDFLYLESRSGALDHTALAERLGFFLWNSPLDAELLDQGPLTLRENLRRQTDRMLADPRSARFVDAFLDYWLDLREINANAPDAELYPDYYLDDLLTESAILETQHFFRDLVTRDRPARHLIQSDIAFVNERLARHYGLDPVQGAALRRVRLPAGSPRGGLLTQSSVLRVTANGTTTSPVVRGAWVARRLLGLHIPPPPSGVGAIEPDIRGAKTIREQLDKHREVSSCAACHAKFDGIGFALENFDIAGGWRDRYRAVGEQGDPVTGLGKNGHAFKFRLAQTVDSSGQLVDGRAFRDIFALKRTLARDERAIARNLVHQFIVYATGAPVSFADRPEVESILDACRGKRFGVRSLLHAVVQSQIFQSK